MSGYSAGKQADRASHMAKLQYNPEGKPSTSERDKAAGCESKASKSEPNTPTRSEGKAARFESKAARCDGKASRPDSKATRPDSKATRSEDTADVAREPEPSHSQAAQWEMLGAQLAPGTYGFYSTEASAIAEDASMYAVRFHPVCMHASPAFALPPIANLHPICWAQYMKAAQLVPG